MANPIERTQEGMDALIDRGRDAVVGATDRAERSVEKAAEGVAERAHRAGDYVRDGALNAALGAHRHLEDASLAVDRGYNRARSDLSRAAAATTDFLIENPGKALLMAAAAGFLLGGLVLRQRSPA